MTCASNKPVALRDCPLILSTDVGGDPDDAITLALAAMTEPRLELVITADELPDGRRSMFARHLLDLLGREEVVVAAGATLGESKYWAADGLIPPGAHAWPLDLYTAVATVCGAESSKPLRWLGIGPMTDLAQLLEFDAGRSEPLGLARRLRIWQMGGALERQQDKAEHNFRLDPAAVRTVLDRVESLALVLADHTFTPVLAVDADSPIYRMLAASRKPWAQLIARHLEQWFDRFHPASMLHDPLTFAALRGDFVSLEHREFWLDPDGQMHLGPGHIARLSSTVDYPGFLTWVRTTLRDGGPVRLPGWDCSRSTLHALAAELRKSIEQ
ncbi:inosine-uridine nucleoside N-ribohydrolase [Nocardia tenerifensis]|uniref:Inosine-uridine nucleoside N-ribohydrolase n=1 Tax=Nocardia tenerifensis TaxID=228006 RepID=A0A318JL68_9NOCA|nr:nucleoside hydrolase [Nocardia tenerifensis]PXX53969.1 inosine-uridine nucleoside N-ribohydrolase [Nocardia tenerifensis]